MSNLHKYNMYLRQLLAGTRLAQSVERKALNLVVVVGSSPTVGVLFAAARSSINIVSTLGCLNTSLIHLHDPL